MGSVRLIGGRRAVRQNAQELARSATITAVNCKESPPTTLVNDAVMRRSRAGHAPRKYSSQPMDADWPRLAIDVVPVV